MTNAEFCKLQDEILKMSGRELADKLRRSPSDIARWRKDVEIPGYIEELLGYLVREHLGTLTMPLTISDINGIIRLATARGQSFEGLLVSLIRNAISLQSAAQTVKSVTKLHGDVPSSRAMKPLDYSDLPSSDITRLNEGD